MDANDTLRGDAYEWSDDAIGNVLAKAEELDRRRTQRQETRRLFGQPLVRSAIETGHAPTAATRLGTQVVNS